MSSTMETAQLAGEVSTPGPLGWERLRSLPQHTVPVLLRCSTCDHKDEPHEFTGVRLVDLLDPILSYPADDYRRLRLSIVVKAKDNYAVTIAWGEVDANFGAQSVLVAWGRDGGSLPDGYGPLQLVVPEDEHSGRCVHAIASILVHDPLAREN